jgi:hypothetical protein
MTGAKQKRRGLLQAAGALLGGGTVLSFTSAAGAWSVESVSPDSPVGLAYFNRCGGASEHAALQSQLRIALKNDLSAPSMSATCPICGCPVVVNR